MSDILQLEKDILDSIAKVNDSNDLEAVRVSALGKKGKISLLMKNLGQMDHEERKKAGAKLNLLKNNIAQAINTRKNHLQTVELNKKLETEKVDVTLPLTEPALSLGRIHPISQVMEEINVIFADLEFDIAEGSDIEDDFHNFSALNIPESHPARQDHDTFYFPENANGERKVLRTHTSPVQIRTMETQSPPIRIIAPGRTYRCDSDQTHTPMFHQVEALVIDKSTHLGNLKWILEEFCKAFFEVEKVKMRYRSSYFPFTEPSVEVDIGCERVGGELRIGEGDGWLEILGSGMVHPQVLRNVDLDPQKYQGFAFGIGIDRLAMLKYGIPDLRAFFDSDLRWLRNYGFACLDIPSLTRGLSR